MGILPNDKALIRLAASVVIEQNDEWLVASASSFRHLHGRGRYPAARMDNAPTRRDWRP
jgi:hypothetical protein